MRKLEELFLPNHYPTIVMVQDKDGNLETMNYSEFEIHRHDRGIEFVRFVRLSDLDDLDDFLNSIICVAQMDKDIEGK